MATQSIKCFNFLGDSGTFVIVSHHRFVRSFTNRPVFTLTGRISYMFQAVRPVTCWRLLQECVWFAGLRQGGWQEVRPPPIWYKISRSNPSPPLSVTWLGAAALVVKAQKRRWVFFKALIPMVEREQGTRHEHSWCSARAAHSIYYFYFTFSCRKLSFLVM